MTAAPLTDATANMQVLDAVELQEVEGMPSISRRSETFPSEVALGPRKLSTGERLQRLAVLPTLPFFLLVYWSRDSWFSDD